MRRYMCQSDLHMITHVLQAFTQQLSVLRLVANTSSAHVGQRHVVGTVHRTRAKHVPANVVVAFGHIFTGVALAHRIGKRPIIVHHIEQERGSIERQCFFCVCGISARVGRHRRVVVDQMVHEQQMKLPVVEHRQAQEQQHVQLQVSTGIDAYQVFLADKVVGYQKSHSSKQCQTEELWVEVGVHVADVGDLDPNVITDRDTSLSADFLHHDSNNGLVKQKQTTIWSGEQRHEKSVFQPAFRCRIAMYTRKRVGFGQ